jgi:beta-lactam-binding protein with PASTA domain
VKVAPATLTVPSVVGIAFVFAKSQLGDEGFSWRVAGSVHGYPANTVIGQSPAPGTVVVDTGAPPVTVRLRHNGSYVEHGTPEDRSPFRPTRLRLAH